MQLTIGSTTIDITSCTRLRDLKRGFYLDIKIPKENIGMDDLCSLFEGNEQSIVITDDNGTENVYNGFKLLYNFSLENGVYQICQACTSEIEAQLSLAQNKIAAQDATIKSQTEQVTVLEEANTMQMSTIDSLLLEVIPAVITEAVTAAVAEALAANSTTEDTPATES